MRVTTKLVLDMNKPLPGGKFEVIEHEYYEYEGPAVALMKGDDLIRQQEQMQLGFNKQLAAVFSQTFSQQHAALNFLNQKLTGAINNPQGFTPQQMAALNTGNTEAAANAYAHAAQATNAAIAARGGSALPSGVNAQLTAANANAGAAQLAQGENQIALADAAQRQSNYWNAVSGLGNVAAQENPTGFGSLYNGGSGNVGSLGEAFNSTQQSPLLATLGGLAGGAISTVGQYYGQRRNNGNG